MVAHSMEWRVRSDTPPDAVDALALYSGVVRSFTPYGYYVGPAGLFRDLVEFIRDCDWSLERGTSSQNRGASGGDGN